MRIAIVKSSELDLASCISPHRFTNTCEYCTNVQGCKLPEGKRGRIRIVQKKIEKYTLKLQEL
jgi:hypothetical protein